MAGGKKRKGLKKGKSSEKDTMVDQCARKQHNGGLRKKAGNGKARNRVMGVMKFMSRQ